MYACVCVRVLCVICYCADGLLMTFLGCINIIFRVNICAPTTNTQQWPHAVIAGSNKYLYVGRLNKSKNKKLVCSQKP